MPTPDQLSCQPLIENCKVETPVQPNNLVASDDLRYYICSECKPGFVWVDEEDEWECEECSEGCNVCKNDEECTTCMDTHMLVGDECIPKIAHCLIPEGTQPVGL